MLIYIHGFNSSAQSGKAREMAAWMGGRGLAEAFVCPDLPHRPAQAIALLEDLIRASRRASPASRPKLVGSSLGGFYATWLAERHDLKAVLVNPCVACHAKLAEYLGQPQKNWHSGEAYLFGAEHLAELQSLALTPRRKDNYFLLVEKGDEVLDYREAVAFYAGSRQEVLEGGDHGFTRFAEFLPSILEF